MGVRIRLAEIMEALSKALDMTEGQPPGHCIRCCFIGMRMADVLGLDDRDRQDLYYTLLLKDLGCSSNAARICQLYLADDLIFKGDFKRVDGSLSQVLRFVLSHTGMQAGVAERFRSILHILRNGGEIASELIETRCQRGAEIARQMRFSDQVAQGILDLDEHFNGKGRPQGLSGSAISPFARIALLAQVADVFAMDQGPEAAIAEIVGRSGEWFDPAMVDAFLRAVAVPGFWEAYRSDGIERIVLGMEPSRQAFFADDAYLDDIAAGFARVIDAKSPFTSGHSERVALYTDLIAEEMGFDTEQRRVIKRAALLHDIGKLGVSNRVLDKPGKLDEDEWAQMRQHALHSETILSHIDAFRALAVIGGAHHEKLDGSGYPRGLKGDEINLETRIVSTADVFDALTADRPYRKAMPISEALAILHGGAGKAHDAACIAALERALERSELALVA